MASSSPTAQPCAHFTSSAKISSCGTAFTLALLRPKLAEHGLDVEDRLVTVAPRQRVDVGPVTVEFLRVPHSIPDCVALALHTPQGVIIHTGDFKIDQTPLDGETFDYHRFAELGAKGVLALFSDSTNADRPGFTSRPSYSSTPPRAFTHSMRVRARPFSTSIVALGSV